ncbi:sugar ABC transporter permease [Actinobacteria bacterium YIM 96077]|uniref:Sugar ABC transporter permease n=1 Tax=Phytoactinopolyspora halophila TaxID=1981511 RepID=A0A329QBZ2_9ACTN|nr:sugar ABC transporter permease [Phytoactinopolyspora halophila]AYY12449.1 sugar ABC transporter permease [Actinobacteria bacterium YIM 96077]RAW09269.1 sugar ABC transporter permease [Phytoactinopolyspora halophila]
MSHTQTSGSSDGADSGPDSEAVATHAAPAGGAPTPVRQRRRSRFPTHLIVFIGPAFAIYTVFMIYPLLDSMRLSLYGAEAGDQIFVGLDNFLRLLTDDIMSSRFWNAVWNNLLFFAVHFFVQNPIGLLLAALLASSTLRGRTFYRTVIFIPTTLSVVIVGFIWQLILSPLWGFVETPLLGQSSTALLTLSLMSVWQYVGIPMILFYAVLIGIPEELVESARVDGATGWQVFWRIKFPLVLPTVGVVSIITYIANMNAFDLIYTVKGALAGPDFATDIMGTFFFRTFFGFQLQRGSTTMGATVATMMFLLILAGVLLYYFSWHRRVEHYEL